MDQGGAVPHVSPGSAARSLRCTRLRGVLRHFWINDGLEDISGAQQIAWSTPLTLANAIRGAAGLPQLQGDDDPAPDLVNDRPEVVVPRRILKAQP